MDAWMDDLQKYFLDATARELGLPEEIVSDHDFREWYRRQLPGEDGSPSIAEKEQQNKEAREFLANFVEGEERKALLDD